MRFQRNCKEATLQHNHLSISSLHPIQLIWTVTKMLWNDQWTYINWKLTNAVNFSYDLTFLIAQNYLRKCQNSAIWIMKHIMVCFQRCWCRSKLSLVDSGGILALGEKVQYFVFKFQISVLKYFNSSSVSQISRMLAKHFWVSISTTFCSGW